MVNSEWTRSAVTILVMLMVLWLQNKLANQQTQQQRDDGQQQNGDD